VWRFFAGREIALTLGMFLRDMMPFALLSVGVMFLTYWLTASFTDVYNLFFLRVAVAALLYVGVLLLCRSEELDEVVQFLFKGKRNL
jgi:hypothetical protein